jgi:hypothetical protein
VFTQNHASSLSRQNIEATGNIEASGKSSHLFVFLSKTFQVVFVILTADLCEGQTLLWKHFWRFDIANRSLLMLALQK